MGGILLGIVVLRAPDVGVLNRCERSRSRQWLSLQPVPEDGLEALIVGGAQSQAAGTGRLQPCRSVFFAQPQDAQTGPVALDGMGAGGQDLLYHLGGGRASLLGPADQTIRTPRPILPVMARHRLQQRGVLAG